jgi:subtilase family serine protease
MPSLEQSGRTLRTVHRVIGMLTTAALCVAGGMAVASPASADGWVDYGPIAHKRLHRLGAAPPGLRLTLQLGLKADQAGIRNAVKAAASPASPTYGNYPSLAALTRQYGASSSVRQAVTGVFRRYGNTARVDATHLRTAVTISVATAQRIFGTPWAVYRTAVPGQFVVLPVKRPRLPEGLAGNVDIVAGLRVGLTEISVSPTSSGGTPVRTGVVAPNCLDSSDPGVLAGSAGLFPNQLLTAYGIAPLQASGLQGQGVRLAIVGEAPTSIRDLRTFRRCFGFSGTALEQHGASGVEPILESSLDAMVVAMVAPRLERFDLWVHPLEDEGADDNDVEGFLKMLAAPVEAAASGRPLPDVISVSYGECEADVAPYSPARTLAERQLAATAALGITVVVASGDSGSSSCASDVPMHDLTAADKRPQTSWPSTSPYVLAVGGTNLTLDANNAIVGSGPWNDTVFSAPDRRAVGGGGGRSTLFSRPWWQPSAPIGSIRRTVPDVSVFADLHPGYPIVCSAAVEDCPLSSRRGQKLAFVGGTSAAAPLVAGMIALWTQQARQRGLPRLGFIPPLLYALAARSPQAFLDITQGTNSLFGGRCCSAAPGYDMATGLGSPHADQIAALLGGA